MLKYKAWKAEQALLKSASDSTKFQKLDDGSSKISKPQDSFKNVGDCFIKKAIHEKLIFKGIKNLSVVGLSITEPTHV